MDIGTEDDREIYITAPTTVPVERPTAPELPAPVAPVPTPEKVPA